MLSFTLFVLSLVILQADSFREYVNLKVPTNNPLKYINGDTITALIIEKLPQTALGSILPVDGTDAVAVFVAEGKNIFAYQSHALDILLAIGL